MALNVGLLERVKQHILEEPRRFVMEDWYYLAAGSEAPACGTVACIAGWAGILAEKCFRGARRSAELLGIPGYYEDLFYTDEWPDDLKAKYEAAYANEDRAAIAAIGAERIDRYIKDHVQPTTR